MGALLLRKWATQIIHTIFGKASKCYCRDLDLCCCEDFCLWYMFLVFFLVLPPKNKCSTFWSVSGKCCHPSNFGTFTIYFLYASFLPATFYGLVAWWFTILASHGKPIFKNKSTRRINRILKGRWWFPESSLMFPEVPQSFLGILKVPQLPSPLKNPTRYLFKTLTIVTSPLR